MSNRTRTKLRFLIVPLLAATVVSAPAQRRGGGRRGPGGTANAATPATPADLAARQLQLTSIYLSLTPEQTAALTGNADLADKLTTEETGLQTNAAAQKAAYATLANQLIAAPGDPPAEVSTMAGLVTSDIQLRVAAAGEIITALRNLTPALTADQGAKLPDLIAMLVGGMGGGMGGGGGRGFGGPRQ